MGQSKRDQQWPKQRPRHVWVQSPEEHHPPDPGIVVDWRRDPDTWRAFVIIVMERQGQTTVVQRWFHAGDLTPIPTRPISPDHSRWHLGWRE